jgi:5-methylcytosine-specific restriction endonuclease McrA
MGKKRAPSQKQRKYAERVFEMTKAKRLMGELWLCVRCKTHKPIDEYRVNANYPTRFPSYCKNCSTEIGRVSARNQRLKMSFDNLQKKMANAQGRKDKLLSVLMKCSRCGQESPRSKWPIERGTARGNYAGKTRKYCCSPPKRTDAEVDIDISERMKTCSACGIRKSFNDFSPNKAAKDGRQTTCRPCRSAKVHSGEWNGNTRRQATIDERSDGTITSELMRERFSVKICPCCDGYMERDDKVLDHIVPLKLGGTHSASNVTVMCWSCNSAKAAHHPSRWLQLLKPEAAARMREHYGKMGLTF